MPKSAQPGANKAIQDICNAEDRDHAEAAIKTFAQLYDAKFPQAVKKITNDQDELLAFFHFPAEHWIHLRWRAVNAPRLVALVRAGARFERGRLVERSRATQPERPHLIRRS